MTEHCVPLPRLSVVLSDGLLRGRGPAHPAQQVRRQASRRHGEILHRRDGAGHRLHPPAPLRAQVTALSLCGTTFRETGRPRASLLQGLTHVGLALRRRVQSRSPRQLGKPQRPAPGGGSSTAVAVRRACHARPLVLTRSRHWLALSPAHPRASRGAPPHVSSLSSTSGQPRRACGFEHPTEAHNGALGLRRGLGRHVRLLWFLSPLPGGTLPWASVCW